MEAKLYSVLERNPLLNLVDRLLEKILQKELAAAGGYYWFCSDCNVPAPPCWPEVYGKYCEKKACGSSGCGPPVCSGNFCCYESPSC
jgi:hypothetical protein